MLQKTWFIQWVTYGCTSPITETAHEFLPNNRVGHVRSRIKYAIISIESSFGFKLEICSQSYIFARNRACLATADGSDNGHLLQLRQICHHLRLGLGLIFVWVWLTGLVACGLIALCLTFTVPYCVLLTMCLNYVISVRLLCALNYVVFTMCFRFKHCSSIVYQDSLRFRKIQNSSRLKIRFISMCYFDYVLFYWLCAKNMSGYLQDTSFIHS